MPLCSLRAHSPLDFKDSLHERRVKPTLLQTPAVHMHCCCSHPQIVALPIIPGSRVGPAVPHNTSTHTPKPDSEKAQETLSPAWAPADPALYTHSLSQQHGDSPALTLEGSNWEIPNPVRLISLNSINFGKNGKNMPSLTCDSTFWYTRWAGGNRVASRFL